MQVRFQKKSFFSVYMDVPILVGESRKPLLEKKGEKKKRKIFWFLVESLIQENQLVMTEVFPWESSSYNPESNGLVGICEETK